MEIDLRELQTLRKTIIEIYRASTDGEGTTDTQNIFDPLFHLEAFDKKISQNKSQMSRTLLNASMRSTQNLFLPSLNNSMTSFAMPSQTNAGGSPVFSPNPGSFTHLSLQRNATQQNFHKSRKSIASTESFILNESTINPISQPHLTTHTMEDKSFANDNNTAQSQEFQGDETNDHKKSRFHNHRKLRVSTGGGFAGMIPNQEIKEIRKPSGLSEFLSMHMSQDPDEYQQQDETPNKNDEDAFESQTSSSSSSENFEDQTPKNEESLGNEDDPSISDQQRDELDLVTSLYHPMPNYPHDKNNFTRNEKMYKMTKNSIYNLIKNMENKEKLNFNEEVAQFLAQLYSELLGC